MMNDIGIGVHAKERGFHNYEAPISWDIRFGIVEREHGLHEVESEIDIDRVNNVLRHIGYLKTHIQDAAVIVHEPDPDTHWLCAYFTASGSLTVTELRAYLASQLPGYMIPSHFIQMDALPRDHNGKVNRRELPLPEGNRPPMEEAHIPARGEVEQTLADIWCGVLKVKRLGVRDNFFDLGGDSISAIQIVARASEAGLRITPAQLLTHQTVDGLAAVAVAIETSSAEQGA